MSFEQILNLGLKVFKWKFFFRGWEMKKWNIAVLLDIYVTALKCSFIEKGNLLCPRIWMLNLTTFLPYVFFASIEIGRPVDEKFP